MKFVQTYKFIKKSAAIGSTYIHACLLKGLEKSLSVYNYSQRLCKSQLLQFCKVIVLLCFTVWRRGHVAVVLWWNRRGYKVIITIITVVHKQGHLGQIYSDFNVFLWIPYFCCFIYYFVSNFEFHLCNSCLAWEALYNCLTFFLYKFLHKQQWSMK